MVIGDIQDMMPVMEGFNISFSCRSEFKLSGPTSSTCIRNGEWEPDPKEVECRHKGLNYFCYLIVILYAIIVNLYRNPLVELQSYYECYQDMSSVKTCRCHGFLRD